MTTSFTVFKASKSSCLRSRRGRVSAICCISISHSNRFAVGDLISTGRFGEMMIGRGEALKWTRLDGQSTLKKSTSGDGEDEKEKRAYADDM